jgi:hypothetical protein
MASNRSLGRLTLDLIAKIGGFEQGMSKAERVAQDRTKKIQRTFSTLQRSLAGIFAAIGAGTLVRSIIRATSEAEESFALLRNAVEQNGGAVGRTTERLAGMAGELQRVTTYGDDAIMNAQQLLLRFQSIQGVNFDRAVKSSLDLAAALGVDLKNSAQLVGKALEAPQKGMTQLERSGVVLDQSQRDLIKRLVETGQQAEAQQALLDGLEKRYKGAATAARDTFGGALKALSNAFGDLLEAKDGVEEVTAAINDLTNVLEDERTKRAFQRLEGLLFRGAANAASDVSQITLIGEAIKSSFSRDKTQAIEFAIDQMERLAEGGFLDRFQYGLLGGDKGLESLKQQLLEIQAIAETVSNSGGPRTRRAAGAAGPRRDPLPSDEFLQVEARLREQIALFGKTGEAAKVAYQIQAGQLDELSAKEQQRVLDLARQIDALKETAEAEKELERVRREFAEYERKEYLRVQESIQGDLEDAIRDSNRQIEESFDRTLENITAEVGHSLQPIKDEFSAFADEAARNMQTAFADFLFDPFQNGLKGMLKGFIDVIRRMVAEVAAAKIFGSMGGVEGVGNFISGLIPGFASGGSFKVGGSGGTDSQLVAFKATPGEMVDIRTPGQSRGGASVTINNHIDARGATTDFVRALPGILAQNNAKVQQDLIQWFNRRGYVR